MIKMGHEKESSELRLVREDGIVERALRLKSK